MHHSLRIIIVIVLPVFWRFTRPMCYIKNLIYTALKNKMIANERTQWPANWDVSWANLEHDLPHFQVRLLLADLWECYGYGGFATSLRGEAFGAGGLGRVEVHKYTSKPPARAAHSVRLMKSEDSPSCSTAKTAPIVWYLQDDNCPSG